MLQQRVEPFDPREQRRDRQAERLDRTDHLALRLAGQIRSLAPAMRPEAQRAAGGDLRVLLAQRSGGGVARIGELADLRRIEILALFLRRAARLVHQPRVEIGEGSALHVDLAADFEHLGRIAIEPRRNIRDVHHIGGHILAHLPVAARSRANQIALLVAQGER